MLGGSKKIIRLSPLPTVGFIALAVSATALALQEKSRGAAWPTDALLIFSLAVLLLLTASLVRRRISYDDVAVTQHEFLRARRYEWSTLRDLKQKDPTTSTLVFDGGDVKIKSTYQHGSHLAVEALHRLGIALDHPIHRSGDPQSQLAFWRLPGTFNEPHSFIGALIAIQTISLFRRDSDSWALWGYGILIFPMLFRMGLMWRIDRLGITTAYFGRFFSKQILWEDVRLLTVEWPYGRRFLVWSENRVLTFDDVKHKDIGLFDEVLGRIPRETPLFVTGARPPAPKKMEVIFEEPST